MKGALAAMMARHAQAGQVDWIGLRPARRGEMQAVMEARLTETGLIGDHARPGKRAVTLIQAEHLPVIAALAGRPAPPEVLRRNLVISGINLLALKGARVVLGEAEVEITGPCPPCSRMEEALGPGGYSALRGHGGVCAMVTRSGVIAVRDRVAPVEGVVG
ncbi:MAG: MOSC domain-containing protein [Shimia sp.]